MSEEYDERRRYFNGTNGESELRRMMKKFISLVSNCSTLLILSCYDESDE
jgi:hypothetical protein